MIDFKVEQGIKAFNNFKFPSFNLILNDKLFRMNQCEAVILSSKIQRLINGDELSDFFVINLEKSAVFPNIKLQENDFKETVWRSFEKLLMIIRMQLTDNDQDINLYDMNLKELCCCKAILESLESKVISANYAKYTNINVSNAVEVLNTLGNEESIKFVAENLLKIECQNIAPELLEKVLRSDELKVSCDRVLEAVVKSFEKHGTKAERLLGCVQADKLGFEGRKQYMRLVVELLASKSGTNEQTEDNSTVNIERTVIKRLLECVEDVSLFNKQQRYQEMLFNKTLRLNDIFKDRINVTANTVYNDECKPENVLLPEKYYCSVRSQSSRGQWIKFDFPDEVVITQIDIKPCGNELNPKSLKIESISNGETELIKEVTFSNESYRMHSIPIGSVQTKSIRILMDGETYYTDDDQYALWLYEVVFNGKLLSDLY